MGDMTQLGTAFIYLQEYQYGYYQLLAGESAHLLPNSTPQRFYFNALHVYVAAWFLTQGGFLRGALDGHGLEAHIAKIDACLERPVGKTTVGEIIRTFRNKYVVHNEVPSAAYADTEIVKRAQVDWPTLLSQFWPAFIELSDSIVQLGAAVYALIPPEERIPEHEVREHLARLWPNSG